MNVPWDVKKSSLNESDEEREEGGGAGGEREGERALWSTIFGEHWEKDIQKFLSCRTFIRAFIILIEIPTLFF